jgi:hypothetical protein
MKMDAMQKRRMWKVAIVHFALSVLASFIFLYQGGRAFTFSGPPIRHIEAETHQALFRLWFNFWEPAWFCLQPQFLALMKFSHLFEKHNVPVWIIFLGIIISVPLWSICFSWIFVKLDNWLNHFPVLGKKVF